MEVRVLPEVLRRLKAARPLTRAVSTPPNMRHGLLRIPEIKVGMCRSKAVGSPGSNPGRAYRRATAGKSPCSVADSTPARVSQVGSPLFVVRNRQWVRPYLLHNLGVGKFGRSRWFWKPEIGGSNPPALICWVVELAITGGCNPPL